MKRLALSLCLAATLSACSAGSLSPPAAVSSPAAIANQTKIDEQVGLTVTLAYTAAARAAGLAISTGLIKDKAQIAQIGVLNDRAYAAVLAVRDAYKASNASGYLSALSQARSAVSALLAAVGG